MNQYISTSVEDGTSLNSYVAIPEGAGPFPGIIVLQEAFGVNNHIRDVTERFTKEGFVAIAPELFHRSAGEKFEVGYSDFSLVMPHLKEVTVDSLSFDLESAYKWLQEQPNVKKDKIVAIGFCLGGRAAFLANAVLPLCASVSFYGSNIPSLFNQFIRDLHGPQMFIWGGDDQHIPKEQIDEVVAEMEHVQKPYINKIFPGAGHAFFRDEGASYNPTAAIEAWKMALDFFRENI